MVWLLQSTAVQSLAHNPHVEQRLLEMASWQHYSLLSKEINGNNIYFKRNKWQHYSLYFQKNLMMGKGPHSYFIVGARATANGVVDN